MQAQYDRAMQKRQTLDVISVKRNPYLMDYEEQKKQRSRANGRNQRAAGAENRRNFETVDIIDIRGQRAVNTAGTRSRKSAGTANGRNQRPVKTVNRKSRYPERAGAGRSHEAVDIIDVRRRNPAAAKRAAEKRRRKRMRHLRMVVGGWALCFIMIGWLFLLKAGNAAAAEQDNELPEAEPVQEEEQDTYYGTVQGLPADKYMKHPAWTEDFLPMNEYSRPGEALPEVNDIFVHYTANQGTSAAQNRSYFEQQKDMHEASVSAHFIIGYEGEIIQCVPLDEIAYAVMTRNYDSISIECCYKAEDGSFTKETYRSLVSLLAWLTDAYDLDTSHILRHYDCGGKKCPVYYTEHEDAWEQLKADVAAEEML